jgi:hypothetical protein
MQLWCTLQMLCALLVRYISQMFCASGADELWLRAAAAGLRGADAEGDWAAGAGSQVQLTGTRCVCHKPIRLFVLPMSPGQDGACNVVHCLGKLACCACTAMNTCWPTKPACNRAVDLLTLQTLGPVAEA